MQYLCLWFVRAIHTWFERDTHKIAHKKLIKPESGIIKTGYTTSLEDGDGDSDAIDRLAT